VRIESLSDLIGLTSTVQIEPEPMALELKVVLIGERLVYYLLSQYDAEFPPSSRSTPTWRARYRARPRTPPTMPA
jgi:hypothetical protein